MPQPVPVSAGREQAASACAPCSAGDCRRPDAARQDLIRRLELVSTCSHKKRVLQPPPSAFGLPDPSGSEVRVELTFSRKPPRFSQARLRK